MRTLSVLTLLAVLFAAVPFTGYADEDPAPINAHFEDADVRQVLTVIAKAADINLIVSPKVKGRITLKLNEVPWRAALEQVVATVGAKLIEEDYGILRIVPKDGFDRITVGGETIEIPRVRDPVLVRVKELEKARAEAAAKAAEIEQHAAELRKKAAAVKVRKDAEGRFWLDGKQVDMPTEEEWEQAAKGERPPVLVFRQGDKTRRPLLISKSKVGDAKPVWVFYDEETGRQYHVVDGKIVTTSTVATGKDGKVIKDAWGAPLVYFGQKDGKYEIVVEKDGTVWNSTVGTAGGAGTATRVKGGSKKVVAGRRDRVLVDKFPGALELKRAQDLEAAAKHLKAAGDEKGAQDLYRRARQAYEAARRDRRGHDDDASMLHAVNALRRDVGQLRSEVRQLTGLLRQLLSRRRPPNAAVGMPGSGGRGGAFFGRGGGRGGAGGAGGGAGGSGGGAGEDGKTAK